MHTGDKFISETKYVCKCMECAAARKTRRDRIIASTIQEREAKLDAEREASLEAGE